MGRMQAQCEEEPTQKKTCYSRSQKNRQSLATRLRLGPPYRVHKPGCQITQALLKLEAQAQAMETEDRARARTVMLAVIPSSQATANFQVRVTP